ncbi:uncharacterized protein LOC122011845 isoform X2 [Zingiber officinale]|uniref:uncharacterized protein LOC122011845 isoform X2 n=1 Tax=Zingiber officinale TaxID=94328 RepID=UPI001C4CA143|nr:uncharacterized protein LOC122011845 isoform X2 [Zingiber officinale]
MLLAGFDIKLRFCRLGLVQDLSFGVVRLWRCDRLEEEAKAKFCLSFPVWICSMKEQQDGTLTRKNVWPRLLFGLLLLLLLAICGSKGPYFKLYPISRRMLLQTIIGSPAGDAKMEINTSKLPRISSFPHLQTLNLDTSLTESESMPNSSAPSLSMVTQGTPSIIMPKLEILPPTSHAVVPSIPPSSLSDHITEQHKQIEVEPPKASVVPDAPTPKGIPQADWHGKAHDNSRLAAAPVAHGPVASPVIVISPAIHENSHIPVAAPPLNLFNHPTPVNYSNANEPIASPVTAPSVPPPPEDLANHTTPDNDSYIKGPAISPATTISPAIRENSSIPVAAPPLNLLNHSTPVNYSHEPARSPVTVPPPVFHESHGMPVASPPEDLSNYAAPTNGSRPEGPATPPVTAYSPAFHDNSGIPLAAPPQSLSNQTNPLNYSHAKGPIKSPVTAPSPALHGSHGIPVAPSPEDLSNYSAPVTEGPVVSPVTALPPTVHVNPVTPVAAPPEDLSNNRTHHNDSNTKGTNTQFGGPAVSPVVAPPPSIHENYGMPVAGPPEGVSSHVPPRNDRQNYGMPVAAPPEGVSSHVPPRNDRHSGGSLPAMSPAPHEAEVPSDNAHGPLSSHTQPPSETVPESPPPVPAASSHHHQFTPRKRAGNPSSAPSPLHTPDSYYPAPPSLIRPKVHAPPPHNQDNQGTPRPAQSRVAPSTHHGGPIQFPAMSPFGFVKPKAPKMRPIHALPPPPPNLDCTPPSCRDPYTNSRPGSPCTCVLPMNVGLRLSIPLITFFPWVFDFAQEIASGTSIEQSQVRIMGANAANELPDKTDVLIDLLPFGDQFENSTVFSISQKFWHKELFINSSLFGDYLVLYVTYPGLPSPPMAPGSIDNHGSSGGDSSSRTLHPFAVDVGKREGKQNHSIVAILVLSAVITSILCIGVVWILLLKYRTRSRLSQAPQGLRNSLTKEAGTDPTMIKSRPTSASASFSSSIRTYAGTTKTFSLHEMEQATNSFDHSKIIGEGGFGRVYEGTLEDGMKVAIKVLKRDDRQGNREFLAEVEMLSRLHHRNLIKLIGICTEVDNCLVYELVRNGSVDSHLYGADKEVAPLNWYARLKIALGAARGLAYLHEDSNPRVIHRDFKSSNILLEEDFNPKVSDFGLARAAKGEGNEYISTRVMGTFGYVAPEYAMTGHLLVKSDVYSYGVVLLELLTGRKPVDMLRPPGQENLVTWARPLLSNRDSLESIIDPSLYPDITLDSLTKVAAIASMCVQPEVDQRPFMGEVVQALKLVCNTGDDFSRVSGSCSLEETSILEERPRISTGWDLGSERMLPEPDVFSMSARFTRDASGSFRRYSSSGPLRPGSSSLQFWHQTRGLTSGSASEHGNLDRGLKTGDQLV